MTRGRVARWRRLLQRDPPQRARVRGIDQRRRMQQRRVVPDDDVADAVREAQLVFRLGRVRGQLVEQRARFVVGHADDAERAARHRIKRLAPGDRMRARERVRDQRHLRLLLVGQHRRDGAARLVLVVAVAVVMDAEQRIDAALHRVGQVVVRGVLVGEQRIAAARGHLDRIERRRARRNVQVRIVGVEVRAGVGRPIGLPFSTRLDRIRMFGSAG